MPILKDFRKTKTISLPSYKDSEVEIYNSLLACDSDYAMQLQENPSAELLLKVLPKFIKKWNFTDEKKNILEINGKNLNLISEKDLIFIINSVKEFNEELKKK